MRKINKLKSVKLPDYLHRELKTLAASKGKTMSGMIAELMTHYVKK